MPLTLLWSPFPLLLPDNSDTRLTIASLLYSFNLLHFSRNVNRKRIWLSAWVGCRNSFGKYIEISHGQELLNLITFYYFLLHLWICERIIRLLCILCLIQVSFGWCSARRRVSLMTMKAENNVLGQGLTLLALYNIVQCRVLLHKLVRVNYSSNVFLFLLCCWSQDFYSRMTRGDYASHFSFFSHNYNY